jgi:U3 small nucleolar RNA-associated protein 12
LICDKKTPAEVTCIEQNPINQNQLAVGYLDGSLHLFDLKQKPSISFEDDESNLAPIIKSTLTFNGHKSTITSISFDENGVRLVSGSKDTELVVWDLVGECGLFRLKGHKSPINKAIFMNSKNILISGYIMRNLKKKT